MIELRRDRRKGDGDAERHEREVEPRQPQRRHPGHDPDPAGNRGRDRDRLHVLDTVIRHEDRSRVRADRDERSLPERDLTAGGEHVEPEDGDEVRTDGRELHHAELREQKRQHDEHREAEPERPELERRHTRLTAVSPKSPAGRTSSPPRITVSAIASRSSSSIQWM